MTNLVEAGGTRPRIVETVSVDERKASPARVGVSSSGETSGPTPKKNAPWCDEWVCRWYRAEVFLCRLFVVREGL